MRRTPPPAAIHAAQSAAAAAGGRSAGAPAIMQDASAAKPVGSAQATGRSASDMVPRSGATAQATMGTANTLLFIWSSASRPNPQAHEEDGERRRDRKRQERGGLLLRG